MLVCAGCSLVERVQLGGTVVLHPSATYLLDRLDQALALLDLSCERHHSTLSARVGSFQGFVRKLITEGHFTEQERLQIRIAHLLDGERFGPDLLEKTRTLAQWELMLSDSTLLHVLQNESLVVHFQPIVDLQTRQLYGHECLVRGIDPQGQLVPPSELLREARQTDLLFSLDRLMREVCLRAAQALTSGHIFINFIPTSIYNPEFCLRTTERLAHELGLAQERIVFEVVETEKVEDGKHLVNILNHYRDRGFKIALDDVAAGYSGLLQLMKIRPDIMKMDREVISGVHQDPDKQAMLRAMLGIAADYGIIPLAEGVETADELRFLEQQGVRLAQGYHFGRPSAQPATALNF